MQASKKSKPDALHTRFFFSIGSKKNRYQHQGAIARAAFKGKPPFFVDLTSEYP
jgi:hypothetical protein